MVMDYSVLIIPLAILAVAFVLIAQSVDTKGSTSIGLFKRSFTSYADEIQTAAFRFIGMPSLWPSYLGGGVKQIGERKARIARKRQEADALPAGQLRDCVHAWLDYYEKRLPEQERELVERISRRELDAYIVKEAERRKKVEAVLRENGL